MRPLDILPSAGPLPEENQKTFWDEYLRTNYLVSQRVQQILKGKTILADSGESAWSNVDTATVDLVLSQDTYNEVNNPLDREPVGVIGIMAPGIVRPRWSVQASSLNVTAGSVTVTGSSLATSMSLGYLVAQSVSAKILTYVNSTTLTLYEPWPGSTASGIDGAIMHRWAADTVWLWCEGTSGYEGLYRLLFF